jgi:hypothetical protein
MVISPLSSLPIYAMKDDLLVVEVMQVMRAIHDPSYFHRSYSELTLFATDLACMR